MSPRKAQPRKLRDIAVKKGCPLSSYPGAIKLGFGFSHFAVSAGNLPRKFLQHCANISATASPSRGFGQSAPARLSSSICQGLLAAEELK